MARAACGLVLVAALGASGTAVGEPLMSPSGFEGAGLGKGTPQQGRAWADLGYSSHDGLTVVAPTLGLGFLPIPQLELQGILPLTHTGGSGDSETAVGNVYLGANYLSLEGETRWTLGFGTFLATGPSGSGSGALALAYGTFPEGFQHAWLRIPASRGFVVPAHLEGGSRLFGSLDLAAVVVIPTDGASDSAETEWYLAFAPGMGLRLSQAACLGVRVPIFWFASADTNDKTQTTIEPYARFDIEKWFISGRLNFPVDDPLQQFETWGLLLGAGAGF